jgi:hypothetical protein
MAVSEDDLTFEVGDKVTIDLGYAKKHGKIVGIPQNFILIVVEYKKECPCCYNVIKKKKNVFPSDVEPEEREDDG